MPREVMLACVGPSRAQQGETVSTLTFASSVKKVLTYCFSNYKLERIFF